MTMSVSGIGAITRGGMNGWWPKHDAGRGSGNIDGVDAYVGRCPKWSGWDAINAIRFRVIWREDRLGQCHGTRNSAKPTLQGEKRQRVENKGYPTRSLWYECGTKTAKL